MNESTVCVDDIEFHETHTDTHTCARNIKAFEALVFSFCHYFFYDLNSCDEPSGKATGNRRVGLCAAMVCVPIFLSYLILFCCLPVLRYSECWSTSPTVPWLERLGNQMLIYFFLLPSSDSNAGHWDCNHTVYLFSYVSFGLCIFVTFFFMIFCFDFQSLCRFIYIFCSIRVDFMVFTVSVIVQHATLVFVYTVNYLFYVFGRKMF